MLCSLGRLFAAIIPRTETAIDIDDKITVYCPLSGLTPEIACSLLDLLEWDHPKARLKPGPLVLKALESIDADDGDEYRMKLTVIGVVDEDGELIRTGDEGMAREDALRIPDSRVRVIPNCVLGDEWNFGYVDRGHDSYMVSHGTNIMVESESLAILSLATNGRMTPERVWRIAMRQGFSVLHASGYTGFDGIDYGEVREWRCLLPQTMPGFPSEELVELESMGDVDLIRKAIIHKGQFWIWMRPDRFPLWETSSFSFRLRIRTENTSLHATTSDPPTLLEPPSSPHPLTEIEQLPFELISRIASQLPLPSLLSLLSTSHHIRFKLLGFVSDRDTLARAWITTNAPWYQVVVPDNFDFDEAPIGKEDVMMGWGYLRRCVESGPMRNRRRIWGIAKQLERKADEMGV